jgi:hypothetical protein
MGEDMGTGRSHIRDISILAVLQVSGSPATACGHKYPNGTRYKGLWTDNATGKGVITPNGFLIQGGWSTLETIQVGNLIIVSFEVSRIISSVYIINN